MPQGRVRPCGIKYERDVKSLGLVAALGAEELAVEA